MLGKRLGIDLGTANTLVWLEGKGIVINEPTVVAVTSEEGRLVAVGNEAKTMLGKAPANIEVVRPLRDGVIANYAVTEAFLRFLIQKACGRAYFFKPEVMVCIPGGVTQVEKRAVLDATISAGARIAYLIDSALAAAIGAKIPIVSPYGNMIVDMGGGASEAAVISLGGVVVYKSIRVAGNKIDEAIAFYLRKRHNLIVGDQTAEDVKIKIGSALTLSKDEVIEVKGRDSLTGLPKLVNISSSEVTEAIKPILNQIIGMVKAALEETPPELASDIVDRGIVLSGGTSLLRNLDRLMTQELKVPCHVVEEPILSVIKGIGIALENIDLYKKSLSSK